MQRKDIIKAAVLATIIGSSTGNIEASQCQPGGFYGAVNIAVIFNRCKFTFDKDKEVAAVSTLLSAIKGKQSAKFTQLSTLAAAQGKKEQEIIEVTTGLILAAATKADGSLKTDWDETETLWQSGKNFDNSSGAGTNGSPGKWLKDLLSLKEVKDMTGKFVPSQLITQAQQIAEKLVSEHKKSGEMKDLIASISAGSKMDTMKGIAIKENTGGTETKSIPSLSEDTTNNYVKEASDRQSIESELADWIKTAREAVGEASTQWLQVFFPNGDKTNTALTPTEVAINLSGLPAKLVEEEWKEFGLDQTGFRTKRATAFSVGAAFGYKFRISDLFVLGEIGGDFYFGRKIKIQEEDKAADKNAPALTAQQKFGFPIQVGFGFNITTDFEATFLVGGEFQGHTIDTTAAGETFQHMKGIESIGRALNARFFSSDATKKDAIDLNFLNGKAWADTYKKHNKLVFAPSVGVGIMFAATPQVAFRAQYRCCFQKQLTTIEKVGAKVSHSSHKIIISAVFPI
ncbi:MAG: hypothetical protein LBF65_03685 [Holosporales bacterium]|jgi:hypothetical protein|nr:hypothetical protein [Holosporales bacterium]